LSHIAEVLRFTPRQLEPARYQGGTKKYAFPVEKRSG
jgi:hypothetical protein